MAARDRADQGETPTFYGTTAYIEGIAHGCHRRRKPLIVDEAWGANLPFHDDLPTWAMGAGADVCVVSVHKMGAGFEQALVLHAQGDLIDMEHPYQCADLLMTTSPSTLVYGALDGWRRQMVEHGPRLLGHSLDMAHLLRSRIAHIEGMRVLDDELIAGESTHELDRVQTLIDVRDGLGISGYQAADWLRQELGLGVGLSDHRRILASVSMADTPETIGRPADALTDLAQAAATMPEPAHVDVPDPSELELDTVQVPREAFFGPTHHVPADRAAGCVSAEQTTPTRPASPSSCPGNASRSR